MEDRMAVVGLWNSLDFAERHVIPRVPCLDGVPEREVRAMRQVATVLFKRIAPLVDPKAMQAVAKVGP